MRVAIDARLLAYQQAGTATYLRGVLAGMREVATAPNFLVVSSRKSPKFNEISDWPRHVAWTPCHHRFERLTLGIELASLNVDVVHSPDFIPPYRFGRRWARVITVHDLAFLRWPELITAESRRYYGQIFDAVKVADRIIAVSEATRRDLLDRVSSTIGTRVVVIPEGVGNTFASSDKTIAFSFVRERFDVVRPFFLFVGTVEPRKNLPKLVRAFARHVKGHGHEVDLVLAGSRGWLDAEFNATLGEAGGSVHVLGRVTETELVALYNAALALVLVSQYEGFGLPALEAMACGCPTIVSNTGSLPEIVDGAGLLVDPGDEEAIGAAMNRLLADDSLRRDLTERGIKQASRFRWKTVAEQTAKVYEQAAACAS